MTTSRILRMSFLDVIPLLIGIIPFAVVSGAASVNIGLSPEMSFSMAFVIFAGAAQLTIVQLLESGAHPVVIILAAVMINVRMVMYSLSLAPYFVAHSTAFRAVLAYFLTDQAYALSMHRYSEQARLHTGLFADGSHHRYYLCVGAAFGIVWLVGTAIGIIVGNAIPPDLSLDFAVPLAFIALIIPFLNSKETVIAALVSGITAILLADMALNIGLLIAIACGITAGITAEQIIQKRQK